MPRLFLALAALPMLLVAASRSDARDSSTDLILPLLPAETDLYVLIDYKQMQQSALSKKYKLDQTIREALLKDANVKRLVEQTGIDVARDVDRFVMTASDTKEPHALFALSGKFDASKFKTASEAYVAKHKEASLVREDGHPCIKWVRGNEKDKVEVLTTLVDGHRLIVGPTQDVRTALKQARGNKGAIIRKKELVKAINGLDRETSIALIGSSAALRQGLGVDSPATAKLLDKTTALRLDVRISTEVKGIMVLDAKDSDAAKELKPEVNKLVDQAKQMVALMTALEPKLKPVGELTRNLKIKVKGRSVIGEVSLSGEAIEALVKLAAASQAPGGQP
jgi:hypothetical protein